MERDGELWRPTRHRRGQWLNNLVEQGHRRIKRRTGPMLGFRAFGPRGGPSPALRLWRCSPRDRCVPCPPIVSRPSEPSCTRSLPWQPDQTGAVQKFARSTPTQQSPLNWPRYCRTSGQDFGTPARHRPSRHRPACSARRIGRIGAASARRSDGWNCSVRCRRPCASSVRPPRAAAPMAIKL